MDDNLTPSFSDSFKTRKSQGLLLSWNSIQLSTSAHKCLFRVFDDSDWRFRQIGLVHGSAASCDGSRFPGIFVRLDDPEVLNFIQREVFGSTSCKVHEKATNDLVDCSFPFVYNGKAYYGCTDIKMYGVPNNHIWCSTKTNSSTYEHIDGSQHWGICPDSSCLKSKCTTKIDNLSSEKPIDLLATNQTKAIELENAIRETRPNHEKFLQLFNKIGNNNPIIYETRKGTPITAMYLAASMGHLRMVEFIRDKLINKNPPLRITGRTPLHVAAQRGCLDVIECIFECLWKEHRNPTDENGITPLHLAATFGQLEALKMFLKENVGKNPASFVDKKTPFHLAAEYGMFNIIEYLADILPPNQLNDKSNSGESALDYARKNGHNNVVAFLEAII